MKEIFNKAGKPEAGLLEQVRASGGRVTRSRVAVLQALDQAEGPLQPEQIRQRASAGCPSIGLVTVYRALALLVDLGQARRLHLSDGSHAYVRATLEHSHHLVCRRCQTAVEVPGAEDLASWMTGVAAQTGFRIEEHALELTGVCPECLENWDSECSTALSGEVGRDL